MLKKPKEHEVYILLGDGGWEVGGGRGTWFTETTTSASSGMKGC